MRDDTARTIVLDRLRQDLVGPLDGPDEKITDRPSDRYLTGMLFPPKTRVSQIEDDDAPSPEDTGTSDTTDEDST